MARLIVEDAVLATGRSPETIEKWILAGRVDAERAGDDWLIDLSSLLNVAAAEDAHGNGNGHGHKEIKSPIDIPADEFGGRLGPIAGAVQASVVASGRGEQALAGNSRAGEASESPIVPREGAPELDAVTVNPEVAARRTVEAARPESEATEAEVNQLTSVLGAILAAGDDDGADSADALPGPLAVQDDLAIEIAHSKATVEVATTAIGALSARLEQAISEIERLQDERMKLAMQLGYSQAQLKSTTDQLRALAAPPESASTWSWLTRIFRRD
ncbi:MAG: hypothetical protein EPO26_03915 [Chloroflexota bacterium]|nr:MAG: hypothetical protein EPO26_03915 [Chloroflexota bacterium]